MKKEAPAEIDVNVCDDCGWWKHWEENDGECPECGGVLSDKIFYECSVCGEEFESAEDAEYCCLEEE